MSYKGYILAFLILIIILLGAGGYIYYQTHMAVRPVSAAQQTAFEEASNKGQTDDAIAIAQQMVSSDPKNISYQLDLANAYLNKGSLDMVESENADKAIGVINQILALNPSNIDASEAYRAMGYAYEIKQQYDQALSAYSKAIELNPQNDAAYANRGHAYDLMGKSDLALADYKTSFSLNSNNAYVALNLARYYDDAGDSSSTIQYAKISLAFSTSSRMVADAQDLIGLAYIDEQDFDSSESALNAAIAADQKYDMSYVDRAFMNLNKYGQVTGQVTAGQAQVINNDINAALAINPKNTSAWQVKFFLAQAQNDIPTAITDANQILAMVDNDIALNQSQKDGLKAQMQEALAEYNSKK